MGKGSATLALRTIYLSFYDSSSSDDSMLGKLIEKRMCNYETNLQKISF